MGITGRDKCKKNIPKKMIEQYIPIFTVVATDREAAKAEVIRRLDALFDSWEYEVKENKNA